MFTPHAEDEYIILEKTTYSELMTKAYLEGIRYACSRSVSDNENMPDMEAESFSRGLSDSLQKPEQDVRQ